MKRTFIILSSHAKITTVIRTKLPLLLISFTISKKKGLCICYLHIFPDLFVSLTKEMMKVVDDLVFKVGDEKAMENANTRNEPLRIEEVIRKDKVTWTYLRKRGLIPFMECIESHDERVSWKFIDS